MRGVIGSLELVAMLLDFCRMPSPSDPSTSATCRSQRLAQRTVPRPVSPIRQNPASAISSSAPPG